MALDLLEVPMSIRLLALLLGALPFAFTIGCDKKAEAPAAEEPQKEAEATPAAEGETAKPAEGEAAKPAEGEAAK
jgi:hypothetical protein